MDTEGIHVENLALSPHLPAQYSRKNLALSPPPPSRLNISRSVRHCESNYWLIVFVWYMSIIYFVSTVSDDIIKFVLEKIVALMFLNTSITFQREHVTITGRCDDYYFRT